MAKWSLVETVEIPSTEMSALHPVLAKLFFVRGIKTQQEIQSFIAPNYEKDSNDPFLFADMEIAVERIRLAKEKKEMVLVYGDYDADGVTSSAIIKETLDALEIENSVYIPDKKTEGYGLNIAAIEKFKEAGISLIITVDCGITSIKEVERANELGMDVVITDHHHVPEETPKAFAVINPHVENCGYPFKELAGVGVAFKFVQAIYQRLLPEKNEQTKWLLDLVAIGTIADCVSLVGENRLLVKYGLVVLSKTRRIGLRELFTVGRMMIDENSVPDTKKVSFYIAPRINAAGRMNHANLAYDLIIEKDAVKARSFALELEDSNSRRQKMTEKIVEEVRLLAVSMFKDKKFIFAVGEHFPIGIVGLIAGKIAQQFNKPVIIVQKGEQISKGSFRSIPQINIIETIIECKEFLTRYGGHSQAAGVSIENEKMNDFFEKMNSLIEEKLEGVDLSEEIKIDLELSAEDVDFELVEGLEKLKPFGEGNREPIFLLKNLIVREKKMIGSTSKHIKFFLSPESGSPKIFEAVSFNGAEKFFQISESDRIDIVCNIQKDEWNGNERIQLIIVDIKKV